VREEEKRREGEEEKGREGDFVFLVNVKFKLHIN
jgi:hypothetical protein